GGRQGFHALRIPGPLGAFQHRFLSARVRGLVSRIENLGKAQGMQQQISVITLGVADLARSRRFYGEGFEWKPVFQNDDIVFYQMNGFVLGTWRVSALEEDMKQTASPAPGAYSLAHTVTDPRDVSKIIARLVASGGTL